MRIILLIITIMLSGLYAEYSPALNQNNQLDQFMLNISSRFGIELPRSFYTKPMHAYEVETFLLKTDSLKTTGLLTTEEVFQLIELHKIVTGTHSLLKSRIKIKETENYLHLNLLADVNLYSKEDAQLAAKGIINPKFTGHLGKVSYFSEFSMWTELQTDTMWNACSYQPYNGNPYNLFGRKDSGNIRASDQFRGGISYQGKSYSLETAIDYVRLGPATHYPLSLSDFSAPITYFKGGVLLGKLKYSHLIGLLKMQKAKSKYIYIHRFEVPFFKNRFLVGINEMVVNGETVDQMQKPNDSLEQKYRQTERDWEWMYMIPFIPFKFAEHYGGDRDNALLSFDATLFFPQSFRWYFEFLLDDISSPLTLFSNDYTNKWAFTFGIDYFTTIAKRTIACGIEYSRVEPWVYTHFQGGSHSYTHFGKSLGNPNGPNSASLYTHTDYTISRRNTLGLFFENVRKNEKYRGGSINHIFQFGQDTTVSDDKETKVFLSRAGRTSLSNFGITWLFNPYGKFFINSSVSINSDGKIGLKVYGGLQF